MRDNDGEGSPALALDLSGDHSPGAQAGTPAGARALAGAQADSHASGVPPSAVPPTSEPAALQASNSQLQALLPVPGKQRCVLSFTRLEGRSCQRCGYRTSCSGLGADGRMAHLTGSRSSKDEGGGRVCVQHGQPTIASHAKREQMYPPLPLCHPPKL